MSHSTKVFSQNGLTVCGIEQEVSRPEGPRWRRTRNDASIASPLNRYGPFARDVNDWQLHQRTVPAGVREQFPGPPRSHPFCPLLNDSCPLLNDSVIANAPKVASISEGSSRNSR